MKIFDQVWVKCRGLKLHDGAWMLGVALLLAASAQAAKVYSFSGKVSRITGTDVEVSSGAETHEFGLASMAPEQRDSLKVGEEVTVWYTMEAQSASRQEAGQADRVAPENGETPEAPKSSPLPKIQDDRAFYNAKVDWNQDSRNGA